MSAPLVSVITAAYNRSNVLRHTIESVLSSTLEDWEMIVVGDACTDDTEDVVHSFGERRLEFINLPVNSGEQATPNNEGVRRARGEFIAFVNQDDLWTRDHLAICLEAIAEGEFVSTLVVFIDPDGTPRLDGVCPRGTYDPTVAIRASSWFMRRTLAQAVGPWRPARELFAGPSQEWLYRAWQAGHELRSIARPTVLAIASGGRKGSYSERLGEEHELWATRLKEDPRLMQTLMSSIAIRLSAELTGTSISRHVVRAAKAAVRRGSMAAGLHPFAVRNFLLHRRRGGFLDALRRTRGLPPLPRGGNS
jgi:glycosyltransferase involved in cell wall biosynthesis